ncbi:MAG: methyltransferase domain-containing protein [Gammaproteobacteria bacterium]|nr:methyltransferase domain-containing protein [Gammaproteobacteria bacterium]
MSSCSHHHIEAALISLYTRLAEQPDADFGWNTGKANARQLGYSETWLDDLPDVVWESAAAVGNPFKLGDIKPGDVVLDVGCGAGADSCVAALQAGDTGKVIGIDCTPAMIAKARKNAQQAGLENIRFQIADFTKLPLDDASIDVVISNGAINLALNKQIVFSELFRVLKPEGRLWFADMIRVVADETGCVTGDNAATWANCVQGALSAEQLLEVITHAGFMQAVFVELTGYKTSKTTNGALFKALRP